MMVTRMPDVQLANAVIKSLSTSDQVCTDITSLCCLNIFVGGRELKADIVSLSGSKPQVSSDSISQLESWPRLNWTVVSPDR
jgi:hypothetical protein